MKVGTDAVNLIYCVNVPAPPKTLLYVLYSVSSPSSSVRFFSIIQCLLSLKFLLSFIVVRGPESCPSSIVHSLCSGPSCLYSFILSVVVPLLVCMTFFFFFLRNPLLFILSLSMHYCD